MIEGKKLSWKIKAFFVAISAVVAGVFYRMGGSGNYPRQARVIGVSAVSIALLAFLRGETGLWLTLAYLASFGACVGALSTYWDFLFGDRDNFYMHGFMIGLSYSPLAWFGVKWWLILIRAVVLAAGMGLVNWLANKYHWKCSDIIEENFRGAFIALTLPLLLC
jgi:hypothetical protein